MCANDMNWFSIFASKCCSDGLGVCNQFTSQLCANENSYNATAVGLYKCSKEFTTQGDFDAEPCVGGEKEVHDWTCRYDSAHSSPEECAAKFDEG